MRNTKIWIGVGAFVIVGAANSNATQADQVAGTPIPGATQMQTSAAAIVLAQHKHGEGGEKAKARAGGEKAKVRAGGEGEGGEGEGGEKAKARAGSEGGEKAKARVGGEGEGGEGGEGGSRGLPPDLDFALKIALMRGHLLAGHHLVQEKRWDNAHEHFQHPGAELYGGVRERLKDYNVPPFESRLKVLANVVRSRKDGEEYTAARNDILKVLDAAEAGAAAKQTEAAAFDLETAIEVLKVAADEYDAALDGKTVVNPVEYQDARAFILVAGDMIEDNASTFQRRDPEALNSIRASVSRLNSALTAPVPPKNVSLDYGALLSEVSRIELAAGKLLR